MEKVRIDVSLCETLSVTQSCAISHSPSFIRSVTGGGGRQLTWLKSVGVCWFTGPVVSGSGW